MKIYILGSGAMAKAMATGLKNSGFEIVLVSRAMLINSEFSNETYGTSYDIEGKNVILAFKPYALDEVSKLLKGKAQTCISVLARTSLNTLKNAVDASSHAICMPNLAAAHNASITPFLSHSSENESAKIKEILDGFGKALQVSSKAEFDAASVISGCAPAYLGLIAEALKDGAVQGGIKANSANELVAGAFLSAAKMLEHTHPALFKQSVCSPGGTTIEGVISLEKSAVRGAMIDAYKASLDKQRS